MRTTSAGKPLRPPRRDGLRNAAAIALLLLCCATGHARAQVDGTILFVTQPPFGSDFTTVNSTFGNHLANTGATPRGGDLYIRYADGTLRNLTAAAGYGLTPGQDIAVREPSVHWSGDKALFSMVVGGTTKNNYSPVYWQIYEVSGLAAGATATITRLPQPANYNNVSPLYGRDDRILFTSDRPRNGDPALYPQLDEYESAPTNTGLWSMNADGSDLRLLDHAVSGVFTPIIASDGRVLVTRWDHLQQDQQNYPGATYGAFNYFSENGTSSTGDAAEIYPEPRSQQPGSPIHGHRINIFFPWQIFEDGTGHETLNHVGRHELSSYFDSTRDDLPYFYSPQSRRTAERLFQLAEDPTRPGYFFATYAPEFQTHAAGQIVALDGAESVNADDMQVDFVTDPVSASPLDDNQTTPAGHPGLFRNPLPMSDGSLIAVRSSEARGDRRTAGALSSRYDFHLTRLVPGAPYYTPGARLIANGISKSISYFDNYEYRQQTYSGVLWELDPVEVRARPRPAARSNPLPAIEAAILEEELGGAGTAALRQFLVDNQLALLVSRNVTRRADRQQDFNLQVAGGGVTTALPGSTPAQVAFLQFFQGDLLRGYANFHGGRRPLAAHLHDGLLPDLPGAPPGSVRIAADGSIAAMVPASRALTWQMTDSAGNAVVRERFWVSFAAGEIRVCANCHGLNHTDVVLGQGTPTNSPEALRELLSWWSSNYGPDPNPTPTPSTMHQLRGRIRYEGSGLAVADAQVELAGPSLLAVASDDNGDFSFAAAPAGDWHLSPAKNGGRANAVTGYDAALVLRATVGLETFGTLAASACDVTGNGSLSSLDAAHILRMAVGAESRLPAAATCDSDWVFAATAAPAGGQSAVAPHSSGASCTPGALLFEPLSADHVGRDFDARVRGDCSGNWTPPAAADAAGVSAAPASDRARLRFGRPRRRRGGGVEIPIWLHVRGTTHSLDVHVEAAATDTLAFRPAAAPDGAMLSHGPDGRGHVDIALASARPLPTGSLRIGSLLLNGRAARRSARTALSVYASSDEVAIRAHVPR